MLGTRPTVLVAGALGLASCFGGPSGIPEGLLSVGQACDNPSVTWWCEEGLTCAWGRCRLRCRRDAECPGESACVAGQAEAADNPYDWERRVCLIQAELGCEEDGDCPPNLYCDTREATCREGCSDALPCPVGLLCDNYQNPEEDDGICVPEG